MKSATLSFCLLMTCLSAGRASGNQPAARSDNRYNFHSQLAPNPLIQQMVALVSADTLLSNLESLVGFHTRHTSSDTISLTTGIGAARNFILGKFQQYAAQTDGGLEASFFVFPQTICTFFNSAHKNVLATVYGTQTPERIFIASGHMDGRSVDVCDFTSFAPSANDDGSGTVVSMELARIFSQFADNFESTLILMAVTGEDEGLFGSSAYADWASENNLDIDGMMTNDVVGNIEGCVFPACAPGEEIIIDSASVRHFSGGPSTSSSRQLARYMKLKAEQYVTDVPWVVNLVARLDRPGRGGDHIPFYENGYPAVRFTEPHEFLGHQHNDQDLIEFMNMSYLARMVQTNIAGLASLAMAPDRPTGLQVVDGGNGTEIFLTWPASNTEPDFAGYRLAYRVVEPEESLFYDDIIDLGNMHEYTLSGLQADIPVYVSISAYDTAGNESLFSQEVLMTPQELPRVPANVESSSFQNFVKLQWDQGEVDLVQHHIYRSTHRDTGYVIVAEVPVLGNLYEDSSIQPNVMYYYRIAAVDAASNVTALSEVVRGRLVDRNGGIILLDGNGIASWAEYYAGVLSPYNVTQYYNLIDSNRAGIVMDDADLSIFAVGVLFVDILTTAIQPDTVALRKFLGTGGKLFITGWQLGQSMDPSGQVSEIKTFAKGTFINDYMKFNSVRTESIYDFRGAQSLVAGYPTITVDPVKWPSLNLVLMEAFIEPLVDEPITEPIYSYVSSLGDEGLNHGKPVGLRHLSANLSIIVADFPLYFMDSSTTASLLSKVMSDFNVTVGIDQLAAPLLPAHFSLHQNYPNPFNPSTALRFALPRSSLAKLVVYDLRGREVAVLVDGYRLAGVHEVVWDGASTASGVYFYRMTAGEFGQTRKMLLLK